MPESARAADVPLVLPVIELGVNGDILTIRGVVSAMPSAAAPATVSARLTISRTSQSGTVNTSQSREVALTPGAPVEVAKTGLSLGPGARLSIELEVSSGDTVIARSRTSVGGAP